MSETGGSAASSFSARKSHRKSRLGCKNCKRRHIKCDETKPQCANCANHLIQCDYSMPASSGSAAGSNSKARSEKPRQAGKVEYQFVAGFASTSSTPTTPQATPSPPSSTKLTSQTGFALEDFALQHHFITSTCFTFVEDEGSLCFWQSELPQLSFQFPFILHLTLALASLHLSRSQPCRPETYASRFDHHYSTGLRLLSTSLSKITAQSSKASWAGSILLCFVSLAKGPSESDYLFFGETQPPEWLALIQGVKLLTGITHDQHVQHNCDDGKERPLETDSDQPPSSLWLRNLDHLRGLIRTRSTSNAQYIAYHTVIDNLARAFESLSHRNGEDGRKDLPLTFVVFTWVSQLDHMFLDALQQKEAVPLIILAHFLVLLKLLNKWFSRGWAEHVLNGIYKHLGEIDRNWLHWPTRQIMDDNFFDY
ncbi:hypothetical protein BDW68DRAFT_154794 [Aspergillus falconensis]